MKIILTGSTGFLGASLAKRLCNSEVEIIAPVRHKLSSSEKPIQYMYFKELFEVVHCEGIFDKVDVFIHTAALAHSTGISDEVYNKVNNDLTVALALAAAKSKVKRFIFISSIGVNGSNSSVPFTHQDEPNPKEAYAISKYNAEVKLREIASETGLEVVIIRPPLIYGKGAPGNFGALKKVAEKNLPLPLGAFHNKKSFVAVDNLIDLIITCIKHPKAANQTFLVSDDEDVSTSKLLKKLTTAAGKKPMLVPVPLWVITFVALLFGKREQVNKLACPLRVDIEHTKNTLNWKPLITLDEGLRRCFK